MITRQMQEQYNKFKQIDGFAKELGITIYDIGAEFSLNNEIYTISQMLNKPSKKYSEHMKYMSVHTKT